MAKATPVVLEPISLLTVTVPDSHQGDVLGDINARRGRVERIEPDRRAASRRSRAMVPAAEIQRYAVDLRSMTGGRGSFVAVHDHYDVLPTHLANKLVADREKSKSVAHRRVVPGTHPSTRVAADLRWTRFIPKSDDQAHAAGLQQRP